MVKFNELYIDSDNKQLVIDISVPDEVYFSNVYLDDITIDNQDTYVSTGPSSVPVYQSTFTGNQKNAKLVLSENDILSSFESLFIIYVRTKGEYAADTPCGMDNITTTGVIADLYPLYQKAMSYIGEFSTTCNIPQGLIDYILQMKMLEMSTAAGDYTNAINYYNKLTSKKSSTTKSGGCGCGNN